MSGRKGARRRPTAPDVLADETTREILVEVLGEMFHTSPPRRVSERKLVERALGEFAAVGRVTEEPDENVTNGTSDDFMVTGT